MTDAQFLLEKYKADGASSSDADLHQQILGMQQPSWGTYEATRSFEFALNSLKAGVANKENKDAFNVESIQACMAVMKIQDKSEPVQYILTVLNDMLREDGSSYSVFEEALKKGVGIFDPVVSVLQRSNTYAADKGAWLVSAIIGHMPRHFTEAQLKTLLETLTSKTSCSELGVLEAITNLLKAQQFREHVWKFAGVQSLVLKFDPQSTASPILYKSVFAIWMASFEPALAASLKKEEIVQKIKAILTTSRTEKVIRLSLTVLKSFLSQKAQCQAICEDIVEEGVLEAVQQLEYEKWRDTELYDDIKELVQLIGAEVKELSNFDRYMRELESGKLTWGFIHSSKFFGENVMKFENNEFKAVKLLAGLLSSSSAETLAVACHDIGEFVSLHPLGKKQVARLGVKERVMELMGSTDTDKREVRREALLCCQKIMLNKWQDVAGTEKK